MRIFDKLFRRKNKQGDIQKSPISIKKDEIEKKQNIDMGFDISITLTPDYKDEGITLSSSPVGVSTGSTANDFYVYEWFIKGTGEIFYVGKGRGNRYKEYHTRAYEAEKIRERYETDSRFVATGLT
ncbi:hypothetical protein AAG068_04655 [Bacillus paramycoides]|uniref:hypothetical protein n=1 Tax=Bacillus paramycoides TaxID=2026194 RepID=UPI003183F319